MVLYEFSFFHKKTELHCFRVVPELPLFRRVGICKRWRWHILFLFLSCDVKSSYCSCLSIVCS